MSPLRTSQTSASEEKSRGLGDLVGRLADNDDRVHMRKRNDTDRAADKLRAHRE